MISCLRAANTLSPPHLLKKVVRKVVRAASQQYGRWNDYRYSTYQINELCDSPLYSFLAGSPSLVLGPFREQILACAENYLSHCFDLLGSGWVQVRHGTSCTGVEGYRYDSGSGITPDIDGRWLEGRINSSNLIEAKRIWHLIAPGYRPIDWHLDFKSGYRWHEDRWYRDIPYGHLPGVDIKVPWELARGQHLPQLAWAYALAFAQEPGFGAPETYSGEFRNQILDFIATNPPRFGVNWSCTMDVAIRVANWLVTYDLMRSFGARFDAEFQTVFQRSIFEHGSHIVANLEWDPRWRNNHYLANVAGLLFVAAYLPRTPITDAWLAYAIREVASETQVQFNDDGSNFEASTSYHRLAAEMVVYSTALTLALPLEKQQALRDYDHNACRFPVPLAPAAISNLNGVLSSAKHRMRLERMAQFTRHITKPSGHIPQIGDNDSGRFLKLMPPYQKLTTVQAMATYATLEAYTASTVGPVYWDEDILDHRHLLGAIGGLFGSDDNSISSSHARFERQFIETLTGGHHLSRSDDSKRPSIPVSSSWSDAVMLIEQFSQRQHMVITSRTSMDDAELYAYPDFGLYLYRSPQLYLAIRCGSIGQHDHGGHAHNDQLSFELALGGEDVIVDPGTYLYTPLPARRNQYRSVKAHFAPQLQDGEPGRLDLDIFQLANDAQARCLYFGKEGFLGVHYGYGFPLYRLIKLEKTEIVIEDALEDTRPLREFISVQSPPKNNIAFSPKYGSRYR